MKRIDIDEVKTFIESQSPETKIYIGGDSELVPTADLSVITAPYSIDGHVIGTLGVIGPTRIWRDQPIRRRLNLPSIPLQRPLRCMLSA